MATKRISRKDMAKMSGWELFKQSIVPYKRLFGYLKPYKSRFGLGILFGAIFGGLNGALIFTVHFVSAVVFPGANAAQKLKLGPIHTVFKLDPGAHPTMTQVVAVSLLVPAVMLLRGIFGYLNSYCMLWTSQRVLNDIRREVFGKAIAQSLTFFNRAKSGELIQIVFNQTRMAQTALSDIASDAVKQPVAILSALVSLLVMDWQFTLMTFVLFPVCIIPVAIAGKKVRRSGAREELEASTLMVVLTEAFAGVRVVKSYARESYEEERFRKANAQMLRLAMRWQKTRELIGPIVEFLASFGIAIALIYCFWRGLGSNVFTSLATGMVLLYPAFKSLSKIHILMQKCLAATTKIFELIDKVPSVTDAPDAVVVKRSKGGITFDDVTFQYDTRQRDNIALRDVSLEIEPGKTYALVGPSGAGKSTMLSLILRFYDPTKGRVLLDGRDIREITQTSLRENIGVVTQETFLFHDTIMQNILYGRLDATEEEVYEAARQAFAHDFIMEKPEGYETVVGDKGSMLSGGQQQRIAIARALLKDAPILLLDEATSALDSESEQKIQLALERLSKGRTVIAIAHRLSTILKADKIVVMRNGKVRDCGTHQELYGRSKLYQRLYNLQFHGHKAGEVTQDVEIPDVEIPEDEEGMETGDLGTETPQPPTASSPAN